MVYGYIRVSTDKQTVENQRYEIKRFCRENGICIGKWIEETISGTKEPSKRLLGSLLEQVGKNDLIICSELSRLGRNLFMIMNILSRCMAIGAKIWTIKDGYRLGNDIQSKVLAFAFGISAEIERNLISQRTKEALARSKEEGRILGRRHGKALRVKLTPHEALIERLLVDGWTKVDIAKHLGVGRETLRIYIRERMPRVLLWR
jgi:DNA invertase Pin-like site-specific DNA recombinase